MMMKPTRLLFYAYSATALVREQLLITAFGYKSHCKHTPTCSAYMIRMIEEKGFLKGLKIGFIRLATCW